MAKSKLKSDYIDDLCLYVRERANKLTVKQLRRLLDNHAHS
jgi:hypothetical protein